MEGTVSSPTPTISTPTPSAAPATSAPSSVESSGKRPTFAEAFAADAAPQPVQSSTPTEPAAIAPVEPTTPESATPTPSSPEAKGPIPFEVHKTALENARAKERDAILNDWKPYEAIRQVSPEVMQSWFGVAERMSKDPVGFAIEFINGLQNDARYAPQLRSHAGKLLAAGRQTADPEPQPDREIVDAQGNPIGVQFADGGKAWAAWHARQELAKVRQDFAPLQADLDQRQHADAQAKATAQQMDASADALVASIRTIVGSDALLPDVHKAMAEHPELSPEDCALLVRDEKVVMPRLSAKAQTDALDHLKTKAAASVQNPGHAAIASTKRPTSFHDASLKW